MDPPPIADELRAIEGRGPCTDAERRAARAIARRLRAGGHRPVTQAVWVRPGGAAATALLAACGVAASVVSVDHPWTGLWIALATLAALPLAPLAGARRATQWVWSGAGAERGGTPPVRLLLACRADARPAPLSERVLARLALPGPRVVLALAVAALAGFAAVRTGGTGGVWLGAGQLLPSAVCIAAVGAFLDEWVARPGSAAAGPAAALSVLATLERSPLARLAPEVVVAGPRAMRAFVRAQRRAGTDPSEVVVIELREGTPGYLRSDGAVLPRRFHPGLIALVRGAAQQRRGRSASPAAAARAARWPAIVLEGGERDLAVLTLGLVAALDRDLAA